MKFNTGNIYMTRGIAHGIEESEYFSLEILTAMNRYLDGDLGELCEYDQILNDEAIQNDDRILAKYSTSKDPIYIITEWDRSATTILFCNEY